MNLIVKDTASFAIVFGVEACDIGSRGLLFDKTSTDHHTRVKV